MKPHAPYLRRDPTMASVVAAKVFNCAFVMLGHGRFSLIDKEDADKVYARMWIAGGSRRQYAKQSSGSEAHYLHRFILGESDLPEIDHINQIGLDNRKSNLRFCTHRQNKGNASLRSHNRASRFKGVRCSQNKKRFWARGIFNKKEKFLGSFATEKEAAKAYNNWAIKIFGSFACLNAV